MQDKFDLVCVGTALVDSIIKGFDPTPVSASGYRAKSSALSAGGEAVNVSIAAAKLGLRAKILCALGEDGAGAIVEDALSRFGVDTAAVVRGEAPTPVTTMFVNADGTRKSITNEAHRHNFHPERESARFTDARAIAIGSLFRAPFDDAEIILSDLAMATYFEEASKGAKNLKTVANFLIVEVNGYLNKNGIGIASFPLPASTLCEIANKQEDGYTHKQCADMLSYCLENEGASAEDASKAKNIVKQSNDEGLVLSLVTKVLDANPQSIEDYKNGKDRAVGFLIGQVMKEAKGKVNPASVAKVMNIELAKR